MLNQIDQLKEIVDQSYEVPTLIFKHSTTCPISSIAKNRLEGDWQLDPSKMKTYYLDLHSFRSISNSIAEQFQVHHESPQVLLIKNGQCVYETSHLDIFASEIEEAIDHKVI